MPRGRRFRMGKQLGSFVRQYARRGASPHDPNRRRDACAPAGEDAGVPNSEERRRPGGWQWRRPAAIWRRLADEIKRPR
jgi:hypothetical protein